MRAVFISLLIMTLPAGAYGQETEKERARTISARGQELFEQGRFLEAAQAFEEAQAIYPHPNNLFNAAKAYEKMAEYAKAAKLYQEFLDFYERVNGQPAPEAADVQRTIQVLKEKAYLALPEVTIDSDPSGAEVFVDDREKVLGQTPVTCHLPEGVHEVVIRRPGYTEVVRKFEVRSREPLRLTFALEREKAEGGLRFRVNVRKARIYVDGKVVAVTPFYETLSVSAGTHQVLVEKDRYSQVSKTVTVGNGEVQEVSASLYLTNRGFSWRGYLGISGMVLGAASLATAAFWARPEANKRFPGESGYSTLRTLTYTGYGVGSALLAGGITMFIWEFARKAVDAEDVAESPGKSFVVRFNPDGGAFFGATGRF